MAIEPFSARIAAIEALRSASNPRATNAAPLREAADGLDNVAVQYRRVEVAVAYTALAELLRTCARLVEWRAAVLEASPDAERFLRSARESHRIWVTEFGTKPVASRLLEKSAGVDTIFAVGDIGQFLETVAKIPLPVGVFREEYRRRFSHPALNGNQSDAVDEREKAEAELVVAFLRFSIDGTPAAETHFMTPGKFHDLEIEVSVSRWPENAESMEVRSLSVDPHDTYSIPVFRFSKPVGAAPPYRLRSSGRALLKFAQSLQARPSEFRYGASFEPTASEQPVAMVGQRTLRIEATDIKNAGLTGFSNLDTKLLGIRNRIRTGMTVPPEDLANALTVLKILANFTGRCVRDNHVAEKWSEEMLGELRRVPEIGSELDEHPRLSRGIGDLAYRGISVELKAPAGKRLTLADCECYAPQAAAYAIGYGKRLAILCVLDSSLKTQEAFPMEDGLDVFLNGNAGQPVCIIVVLMQGNLVRPSDLSP